jgi:hypothetical protein
MPFNTFLNHMANQSCKNSIVHNKAYKHRHRLNIHKLFQHYGHKLPAQTNIVQSAKTQVVYELSALEFPGEAQLEANTRSAAITDYELYVRR